MASEPQVIRSVPRRDDLRNGIETAAKKRTPSSDIEYGSVMTDRYLDYPISGLTPATLVSYIRNADLGIIGPWMELCEQMEDRDGTIAQCLAARRKQIVACSYDVEPWRDYDRRQANEDALPRDIEIANATRDALFGIPYFEDRLLDLLDALGKGIAALEIMWERGGPKRWTIADLVWVPQRKFTYYDPSDKAGGGLRLLTVKEPQRGIPLVDDKWIIHAPRTRSIEPYRAGLFRILVWYYCFKHFTSAEWISFLETFAHPLRVGYFVPGATQSTKDSLRNACQYLSMDQYAILERQSGEEDPIKTMYPETREASDSFLMLVDYCDKETRRTVLHQTLTTSTDGKGSYKLGEIHLSQQQNIKATDSKGLSQTIREQLIKPFVRFNYTEEDAKRAPTLKIAYEPPEDIEKKAKAYQMWSQGGHVVSKKWAHAWLGTKMPEGEGDASGGQQPEPPAPPVPAKRVAAARPEDAPAQNVINSLEMEVPPALSAPVTQYANTVDAWMLTATGNITARVSNYLKGHKEFASDEKFADEFMEWMDKGWGQYWLAGAMAPALIGPYINSIYSHFKASDTGAFPAGPPMDFVVTANDQRFINFMNRSDRFFFSKLVDHASYRGPMKDFLIDEYGKVGGKLWGETNVKFIDGFKKAAGSKAHKLSRYEVDRIIKSTVARGRNWARYGQFADAGVVTGTVHNGGNPCEFCQDLDGVTFEVAKHTAWIDRALEMDDEEFATALQNRTDAHRAAHKSGASGATQLDEAGPIPVHPSCECYATANV